MGSLVQYEMSLKPDRDSVQDGGMQTLMNLDNLTQIDQLAEFLSGTQTVAFSVLSSPAVRYEWAQKTLIRFRYRTLSRRDQGVVIRVLIKVSGYLLRPALIATQRPDLFYVKQERPSRASCGRTVT